ncbi:MAG: hypothetical protein QNL33_07470 [Akkermansiaceae bacterium]
MDRDRSLLDEIAGMVLGGGKSSRQKRGGIIQWLLGLIFKRK